MKWIENGIQFEGTVAEYRELHELKGMLPERKRTGKRVVLTDCESGEEEKFSSIRDAANFLSQSSGIFVSPARLAVMIEQKEALGNYTATLPEKDNTNELNLGGDNE